MANLYTYNPNNAALTTGITLTIGALNLNQKYLPPHLKIGAGFIQVDKDWNKPPTKIESAGLKPCYTISGRKFKVLERKQDGNDYIFIDVTPVTGVKPRYSAEKVNAYAQIICAYGAEIVMSDEYGSAFVSFPCQNAQVEVWRSDGTIHRLMRHGGNIVRTTLTPTDVVKLRIEQLGEQLDECDFGNPDHLRRAHGILAGAIRLAKVVPSQALDLLVEFLYDYRQQLTESLRQEIRWQLDAVNHPATSNFIAYGGNVVPMNRPASNGSTGTPADRKKARAARAEADRIERNTMKGTSHGGGQQKHGSKKKK